MSRPGYLVSPWPWRSGAYLLTGMMTGMVVLAGLVTSAAVGGVLAIVLVGLPLLVLTALAGIPVAWAERHRLRLVDLDPAPDRHTRPPTEGLWSWLTTRLRERTTWQELGYTLLFACVLWPVDAVAVTVALLFPLSILAAPLLMATVGDGRQTKVLKQWAINTWPTAFGVALLGLVLLAPCAYALGAPPAHGPN